MRRLSIFFLVVLIFIEYSHAFGMNSKQLEFLQKQELIFQLLWHTKDVPKNHPEVFERIKNYKLEDIVAACENQTLAKEFEAHFSAGLLPRGQVFSSFREERAREVGLLYGVFLGAKDFENFVAMAAWTSTIVDEIGWLHAFAVALTKRPDARYLRMPNLHEILPHYFFGTDVIMQAYRIKAGEVAGINGQYTIEANNSGRFLIDEQSDESKLSYFLKDVRLNEFYFHYTTTIPFWMSSEDCKLRKKMRGELYYHIHKMILNRYRLERLSHGLGELEEINWDRPITTGFHPGMTHGNGLLFPGRETGAYVPRFKYSWVEKAKSYEGRISKALDLGELRIDDSRTRKLYDPAESLDTFNEFCNALEGNADSPNAKLYGSLDRTYRRILGFAPESASKSRGVPSALEMSFTSLRDPGFYRMCQKIVDYGLRFKQNLPPYKPEELGFDGVRVDYVHVDRLVTYTSSFESTLNHPRVLQLDDSRQQSCQTLPTVKVRQVQLDHKPFNYLIGVSSEHAVKAIVRIFLGPKYDVYGNELRLEESAHRFYELDRWIVDLKQGNNKLERSGDDSAYATPDHPPSDAYQRLVARALKLPSREDPDYESAAARAGYRRAGLPGRLLLPRGTGPGLPLRLLVALHPLEPSVRADERTTADGTLAGLFENFPLDGRALGFPLDRTLVSGCLAAIRNVATKDVEVRHGDGDGVDAENRL